MTKNQETVRDVFAFSLGGIMTISAIVAAPAVADDRLHQDRVAQGRDIKEPKGRLWIPRPFRVT